MPTLFTPEKDLIAELNLLCPQMCARPLREFSKDPQYSYGVWLVDGGGAAINGQPFFDHVNHDRAGFDGGVNTVFTVWLESRGWYLECHDYGTYMAMPIAFAQALSWS